MPDYTITPFFARIFIGPIIAGCVGATVTWLLVRRFAPQTEAYAPPAAAVLFVGLYYVGALLAAGPAPVSWLMPVLLVVLAATAAGVVITWVVVRQIRRRVAGE